MKKTFLISLFNETAQAAAFGRGFFAEPNTGSVFSNRLTFLWLRR